MSLSVSRVDGSVSPCKYYDPIEREFDMGRSGNDRSAAKEYSMRMNLDSGIMHALSFIAE